MARYITHDGRKVLVEDITFTPSGAEGPETFTLPMARAREWQTGASIEGEGLSFLLQHALKTERTNGRAAVRPDVRPADQWTCGNGHLRAQATLSIITDNKIRDCEAMRFIEDCIDAAGPSFASQMLLEPVPF